MALIRTAEQLADVADLYTQPRTENMKLTSAFIHPTQKEIIDRIAKATGKGKGEALRDMIDEWVEFVIEKAANDGGFVL